MADTDFMEGPLGHIDLPYPLMTLPYDLDALEPVISARTLEFHHGKHLRAYVDNFNKLFPCTPTPPTSLENILVICGDRALLNNAGQILNHEMYFLQFSPHPDWSCESESFKFSRLYVQIERQWGTLDAFKADFVAKGVTLFGSGWVWLSADSEGDLVITQEPNAGNPVQRDLTPLLTFDVWEHAYYLDYQNRRAAHLNALWQILDWKVISDRYEVSRLNPRPGLRGL